MPSNIVRQGQILVFLFPQETKLESAQKFSRQISHHVSPDALQLHMANLMAFLTVQMFVGLPCKQKIGVTKIGFSVGQKRHLDVARQHLPRVNFSLSIVS